MSTPAERAAAAQAMRALVESHKSNPPPDMIARQKAAIATMVDLAPEPTEQEPEVVIEIPLGARTVAVLEAARAADAKAQALGHTVRLSWSLTVVRGAAARRG